jgi:hypothetical protein
MILWLASFPRSGNTYLRIVLHTVWGVRSSVVYDVDGVATRIGADLAGAEERPGTLEELRRATTLHVVKTHRPRDVDYRDGDRSLCVVRDGRDALVSWAHLINDQEGIPAEQALEDLLTDPWRRTSGPWGSNVLGWAAGKDPNRAHVLYDDLIARPVQTVATALAIAAPELRSLRVDSEPPSFQELHAQDPGFFRLGRSGGHRDLLTPRLAEEFRADPDNQAAMALLGVG